MKKKQFYLTIYISPAGAKHTTFRLTNKKPKARDVARGEGNCLIFRLVDGDYSTNFHDALYDGTIVSQIGDFNIEGCIDIEKIFNDKQVFQERLEKIKEQYKS